MLAGWSGPTLHRKGLQAWVQDSISGVVLFKVDLQATALALPDLLRVQNGHSTRRVVGGPSRYTGQGGVSTPEEPRLTLR